MLRLIRTYTTLITLALLGSFIGAANRVQAQTYQIDCAILLCLSGGWPASVPCARARAEFIRRITPWPIEPPLQIWRCPMGASFRSVAPSSGASRFYDILFTNQYRPRPQSTPAVERTTAEAAILKLMIRIQGCPLKVLRFSWSKIALISTSAVRSSILCVPSASTMSDMPANTSPVVMATATDLRLSISALMGPKVNFHGRAPLRQPFPRAHIGLERWGSTCPSIYHRSVSVEWRDYEGNYEFEQINY